jgi:hypothetical protein
VATGDVGVAALHALALESELIDHVELRRSLVSWSSVARAARTRGQIANIVHGALEHYDLPDLVGMIPPARLTVREPLDAMLKPVSCD